MSTATDDTAVSRASAEERAAELEEQLRSERVRRRKVTVWTSLAILAAAAIGLAVADIANSGHDNGVVHPMMGNGNGGVMGNGIANVPQNMGGGQMPMHGGSRGGAAPAPGNAHQVNTTLGEFWVRPSSTTASAGMITFTAQNVGRVPHELMVERMPIKMDAPGQPNEDAAKGMIDDLDPGQSGKMTVNLSPGNYMLFCNVSGHFAAGQHTVLRVTG